MPFYQIKLIKVNSVTPTFSFLPGMKVRLGFEHHDNSSNSEISSVQWTMVKGKTFFEFEGLQPTITIPPTESGIYILKVAVSMLGGKVKHGQSSIYIVQDNPISVKLSKPLQFKFTSKEASTYGITKFSGNIIEVYSGDGKWAKAKKISKTDKSFIFELKPNDSITTYNNKIIVRPNGASHKLDAYDSVQMSSDLLEWKP